MIFRMRTFYQPKYVQDFPVPFLIEILCIEEPLLLGFGVHKHPDWSILHRHTLEGHLRDHHCEMFPGYPASGSGPVYQSILAELW